MIDQENEFQRDNLRIIGLPEKAETNRNLDIILQEIIQENCSHVLEQEGKKKVHITPSILNPQNTTPRNVTAKFKSFQAKEKILHGARKR